MVYVNKYVMAEKIEIQSAFPQVHQLTFIMILKTLNAASWPTVKQFGRYPTLFFIFRLFYRNFKIL